MPMIQDTRPKPQLICDQNDISTLRTSQLDQRLLAYALAAVGAVALTPTADAEVVYTPADVILTSGILHIDLDNNRTSDVRIINRELNYSSTAYRVGVLAVHGDGAGAAVVGQRGSYGSYVAAALPQGFSIGPDSPKPFLDVEAQIKLMANAWCYPLAGAPGSKNPQDCHSGGLWKRATQRYLGIRFHINGETHYGWARFSTKTRTSKLPMIAARFTGYAYETEPDKTILAGDEGVVSDSNSDPEGASLDTGQQPASLGLLSLGSLGLEAWRQQKEASHVDGSGQ
jgi:hypothetical protein